MIINDILGVAGIIPVLEIDRIENAAPLAQSLAAGGLRVIELTLRTKAALGAIKVMTEAAPELIIGMGTIRTDSDIERSLSAGAKFLVSPGAMPSLLKAFSQSGAPALPGVATATEAMAALEAGFRYQKFFPAEAAGGVGLLKSLAGPLPDIQFCPTGGISAERAKEYLTLSNVVCVGGSWVATKRMIKNGEWPEIEKNARLAASYASC